MAVGTIVFPRPREAAIVQSINVETQYEKLMIFILSIPADITAGSFVNTDRKLFPKSRIHTPKAAVKPKEYKSPQKKGKRHMIRFQWVSSIELTKRNLEEMILIDKLHTKL